MIFVILFQNMSNIKIKAETLTVLNLSTYILTSENLKRQGEERSTENVVQ